MRLTEWREELKTGNEEIDNQHRELLRKVHDLMQASRAGRGRDEVGRLLWYLKGYVRKHFTAEEKLQQSLGYPDYKAHKEQHDKFFREVRHLEEKHAREGASTMLIVKSIRMMGEWLKQHITILDTEMAAFVRRVNDDE